MSSQSITRRLCMRVPVSMMMMWENYVCERFKCTLAPYEACVLPRQIGGF